jgi:hypothetical protein
MAEVWSLDLPTNQKIILLAYADHCDDRGLCHPSLDLVAWKTGYSRRQIQRVSRELRAKGLVEILGGGNGRGDPYRVRVRTEKGDRLSPLPLERVTSATKKGDVAMSPEPSENHQTTSMSIEAMWDRLVDRFADGRRFTLTTKRGAKLNALWKEQLVDEDDPLDLWDEIVAELYDDDFWGDLDKTLWLPERFLRNAERRDEWAAKARADAGRIL